LYYTVSGIITSVGGRPVHGTDRQTDMINLIVTLRDSANVPAITVVYFMAMFFVPSTFVN